MKKRKGTNACIAFAPYTLLYIWRFTHQLIQIILKGLLPFDFYYILIINNIHDVSHKQGTIIGYSIIFQVMPIYHRLTLIFNKKFLSNFFRPPFTPKYLILL